MTHGIICPLAFVAPGLQSVIIDISPEKEDLCDLCELRMGEVAKKSSSGGKSSNTRAYPEIFYLIFLK